MENKINRNNNSDKKDQKFTIRLVPLNQLLDPKLVEKLSIDKKNTSQEIIDLDTDEENNKTPQQKSKKTSPEEKCKKASLEEKCKKLKIKIKNLKIFPKDEYKFKKIIDNSSKIKIEKLIASTSSTIQQKNDESIELNLSGSNISKQRINIFSSPSDPNKNLSNVENSDISICNKSLEIIEIVDTSIETERERNANNNNNNYKIDNGSSDLNKNSLHKYRNAAKENDVGELNKQKTDETYLNLEKNSKDTGNMANTNLEKNSSNKKVLSIKNLLTSTIECNESITKKNADYKTDEEANLEKDLIHTKDLTLNSEYNCDNTSKKSLNNQNLVENAIMETNDKNVILPIQPSQESTADVISQVDGTNKTLKQKKDSKGATNKNLEKNSINKKLYASTVISCENIAIQKNSNYKNDEDINLEKNFTSTKDLGLNTEFDRDNTAAKDSNNQNLMEQAIKEKNDNRIILRRESDQITDKDLNQEKDCININSEKVIVPNINLKEDSSNKNVSTSTINSIQKRSPKKKINKEIEKEVNFGKVSINKEVLTSDIEFNRNTVEIDFNDENLLENSAIETKEDTIILRMESSEEINTLDSTLKSKTFKKKCTNESIISKNSSKTESVNTILKKKFNCKPVKKSKNYILEKDLNNESSTEEIKVTKNISSKYFFVDESDQESTINSKHLGEKLRSQFGVKTRNKKNQNISLKRDSNDESEEETRNSHLDKSSTHKFFEKSVHNDFNLTKKSNEIKLRKFTEIPSGSGSNFPQICMKKVRVKIKRINLNKFNDKLNKNNNKKRKIDTATTSSFLENKKDTRKSKLKLISDNKANITEESDHAKGNSEKIKTSATLTKKLKITSNNENEIDKSKNETSIADKSCNINEGKLKENNNKKKRIMSSSSESKNEEENFKRVKNMSRKYLTLSDTSDEDEQISYVFDDGKDEGDEGDEGDVGNEEDEEDEDDEIDGNENENENENENGDEDEDEDDDEDEDENDANDDEIENNTSSSDSEVCVKRTLTTRSTRARKPTKDNDFDYNNAEESNNSSSENKFNDSDSSNDKKKKKTKRKRIKNASDSSDDEPGSSNKKRKNIRKLIKKDELNIDTKRAAEIERERRKRIIERQRLYNSIYEKPENIELKELILDFDEKTQEPLLTVDSGLLKKLKPHQAAGVKFMWDACFETIKQARESEGSGCILAHCMGLGKTLQVITLTHTLLINSQQTGIERALVITPLSTLTNWAREYHHWLKFSKDKNIEIYDMSKFKEKNLRTFKLNEWYEEGGVCIIGYDMYRILSNEKAKGLRKNQRDKLQKALVDPGPDIVICDEGHLLKNEKTSLSQAVTKIRSKRRIVLTGTPLQNNLKEYYCMIQFIKPKLLGTYKEYLNRFVNPITNGQYTDSTERDTRLMKHRSHILHKLLEGCIQRRDYSVLAPYLPPKQEYSVFITMSDIQQKIYEYYMTKHRDYITDITGKGAKLFQDFQNLRRIWTHPMCLRVNSDFVIKKRMIQETDEEGSLKDFVVESSDETSSTSSEDSFDSDKTLESENKNTIKGRKTRNSRKADGDSDIEEIPLETHTIKEDPSEWWCQLVPKEEVTNIFNSPKLVLLMKILSECDAIGDKLLLFSQSLQSLDVIEEFLSLIDRKTQGVEIEGNVGDFTGTWQPGIDYYRLDGSCSVENREAMCKEFNNVANLRGRLFLISTRAGSLGINLVAANRVVIFDVSWNPSHDTQSIFRVYRFGQDKPCYIYRFIALGTMEQKVYERQVVKQSTAKRVIDEQQIGRHYNQNDLLELYTYELSPRITREVPLLPKDRLFAELLANYEKLIFKYHEHDSLLENQESDNLSEEERKAAWDEYEIEKTRPPTQPYVYYNRQNYSFGNTPMGGPVTSNKIFGFRTDILLRLLNMKVSIDNPQLAQTQVLQLVPAYLQDLYKQMNDGNPTLYKELLELHSRLEMPQGYYMNPLLYANQAPPDGNPGFPGNTIQAVRGPPTTSTEIVEID